MKVRNVDPKQLKNHPFNIEIYGDKPDGEFVESVKQHGVKTPIRVLPGTDTIVSGHRRRQAAVMAGLKSVPVIDADDLKGASDDEIKLAILRENRQREKTNEQKAREYKAGVEIEKRLAEQRMKAGGTLGEFPLGSKGKAKEIAADAVGMDRKTADKASEVVDEIDAATASGDTERAEALREELNEGSVAAAHRKATAPKEEAAPVDELGQKLPKKLVEAFESCHKFDSILGKLKVVVADAKALADLSGGERVQWNTLKTDLDNVRRHLTFARPHAICPYCSAKSKDCKACKGLGWVGKDTYEQAPKEAKVRA